MDNNYKYINKYKNIIKKQRVVNKNLQKNNIELKDKLNKYENILEEINKIVKNCSQNDYYYKYNNRYLKSEIIEQLRKELEKGEENEHRENN